MRKKIAGYIITIILCAALIAGGTMAWFTHSAEGEDAVFTAGTVSIEANRAVDFNDSSSYEKYGIFSPDRVYAYEQGTDIQGRSVKDGRRNPEAVLDAESDEFFSLGFNGYITVEFEHPVYAPKLVIVTEVTDGVYPVESADVYVSVDGENWKFVKTATNENRTGNQAKNYIPVENLSCIKYVKLVDSTDKSKFDPKSDADGFDVKSIQVEGYYIDELNWNPGDCNTRIFEIKNTGTKAIHLRGKFSGAWYDFDEETKKWIRDDGLSTDNVEITLHENEDGWVVQNGWFYYRKSIPGTYPDKEPTSVVLQINVHLKGEETGNEYQGKRFILSGNFEAIQASNGASSAAGWDYIPEN